MRGSQRRFHRGLALRLQIFGELDNQNRVLRGQADDGDQRHLEVHVVGVAAQAHTQQHAQHAQRHHQQHGQRDRPALVERGQAQEHCKNRETVEYECLRAGELFFARLAGPFVAEAGRQPGRELLHFAERGAGAVTPRGVAADAHRRIAVITYGLHGAGHPGSRRERRQRHHLALVVGRAQAQQVLRLHARRRVSLHQYALHAPLIGEVVDVSRTERGGDGRVDGVETHA